MIRVKLPMFEGSDSYEVGEFLEALENRSFSDFLHAELFFLQGATINNSNDHMEVACERSWENEH